MFHVVFILLLASISLFSKAKLNTECFNRSKRYVKLSRVYLHSQHKIWRSWSDCVAKTWSVFAYIMSTKNMTVSHETSTIFLRNLSHVLTISQFFHPPKNSGWNQSRKKRLLPAGYFFPGLRFNSVHRKMVYLMVTFEKEIPVIYFRFT